MRSQHRILHADDPPTDRRGGMPDLRALPLGGMQPITPIQNGVFTPFGR